MPVHFEGDAVGVVCGGAMRGQKFQVRLGEWADVLFNHICTNHIVLSDQKLHSRFDF